MTTFKIQNAEQAYVWIWLPGKVDPIVAGRIEKKEERYQFIYGASYLKNNLAIPLSPFELPLKKGIFEPQGMNAIHSCLRDGAPDAWGRRLIEYQYTDLNPNELDYMLLSGSNRIGALDFQTSSTEYKLREYNDVDFNSFFSVIEQVENNQPLSLEQKNILLCATGVGGARSKALITDKQSKKHYIAKFSSTTDTFNMIKSEFVAMRLASHVGIDVPDVLLKYIHNKTILLIERFDREACKQITPCRKFMLSGLSLLGLNELEARYASYRDLADLIRQKFDSPTLHLIELYKRLIFNILIGNTDDHARNHSAFFDGKHLTLTPAYDLCPQHRVGMETTQAMAIEGEEGNFSTLKNVLSICHSFQLNKKEAREIIKNMIDEIKKHWKRCCDEAELTQLERERLWRGSFFNPYCFINFD